MIRTLLALTLAFAFAAYSFAEEVTLGELKAKTPESWKAGETNKFRVYSFKIPKGKGDADAELAVFFFGAGSGGGIAENLTRWKNMFDAPEGKKIDDVAKVETFKIDKAKITYLDVSGAYKSKFPPFDPNAKVTLKDNYRMLAVVFECEGGPYFMRLTGPAATVESNKADFDSWLKSFK